MIKYYLLSLLFIACSTPNTDSPIAMATSATADPVISYSTAPLIPIVNQSCTITATMQQDISGTSGKLMLYKASGNSYNIVNGGTQGVQSVSYTFTPATTGDVNFKVHYVKGNSNYTNNFDYFFAVPIIPKPVSHTTAPKFTAVLSATPKIAPDTNYYRFSIRWYVQATDTMTNVVLSGHLLDAVPVSYSVTPTAVIAGTNPEITWSIGNMMPSNFAIRTATFDIPKSYFMYDGALTPLPITDIWHVTADDYVNTPVSPITIKKDRLP